MFETVIDAINTFLYSKLLIVILIGSGIYFTIQTRFPQVRLFKNACSAVMEMPANSWYPWQKKEKRQM